MKSAFEELKGIDFFTVTNLSVAYGLALIADAIRDGLEAIADSNKVLASERKLMENEEPREVQSKSQKPYCFQQLINNNHSSEICSGIGNDHCLECSKLEPD